MVMLVIGVTKTKVTLLAFSFPLISNIILFTNSIYCLQAATGESISAEELGGADVHCSISGCTDHYAQSEEIALSLTRSIVESLNLSEQTTLSRHNISE